MNTVYHCGNKSGKHFMFQFFLTQKAEQMSHLLWAVEKIACAHVVLFYNSIMCVHIALLGFTGLPKHLINCRPLHFTVLWAVVSFMYTMYPMIGYCSRIMHIIRIGLRNILETFNSWCDHHVCLTGAHLSIQVTFWRGLFTHNPPFTNIRKLWVVVEMTCLNICPEVFQPVMEFMPCQVAAFWKARVSHAWYRAPILWYLACHYI